MEVTLRRLRRVGATGVAALVTVWCSAWSGWFFGAIFEPADNARSFWAVMSAVIAAIAVMTGYATCVVGRSARVVGRLVLICAAAWLALAVVGSMDARSVALPVMVAFEVFALAALLPAAWRHVPEAAPPTDRGVGEIAHPAVANFAALIGLFVGALVTVSALIAGSLGLIWAALNAVSY